MADPFTPPAGINHALLPVLGTTPQHSLDDDIDVFQEFEAPNPWEFLNHYKRPYWNINDSAVTTKNAESPALQTFPLTRLPVEVIYYLGKVLPPESAACLALVNKAFYGILGPSVRAMERPRLWRFLTLLEKDMTFFIACSSCLKLHSPFTDWVDFSQDAPCEQFYHPMTVPHTIRYSLVRGIAKAHLQNRNYSEILTATNFQSTSLGDHQQTSRTALCRMVQGSLIVQTQVVVRPRSGDKVTMRSLWKLSQLLNTTPAEPICGHKCWEDGRPTLWVRDISMLADQHDDAHHADNCVHMKHRHTADCCSEEDARKALTKKELIHGVSGGLISMLFDKEKHSIFGTVQGCKECYTDYSITHVDIETAGRCIVLTTWKDMGGIGPGQAKKWDTHRELDDFEEEDARLDIPSLWRSNRDIGTTYCAWEGLDPVAFNRRSHTYEPQLPERVVNDLKKKAREIAAVQDESDEPLYVPHAE